MNQLITATQLTMSTREIAQLLGKQHSNIKISAERLAENGTIALQGSKFEHCGNWYNEWLLNKRDSVLLVAQNCPEFTAAIVDRWQELESQQAPKLPQSFSQALQLAADQARLIEEQQATSAAALNGGCKIPDKSEPWTIYNNTLPLGELSDEKASQLFNHKRNGGAIKAKSVNGWLDSSLWNNSWVYRAKPKSERELFIETSVQLMTSETERTMEQMFGAQFDSGARYTENTQHFGESV